MRQISLSKDKLSYCVFVQHSMPSRRPTCFSPTVSNIEQPYSKIYHSTTSLWNHTTLRGGNERASLPTNVPSIPPPICPHAFPPPRFRLREAWFRVAYQPIPPPCITKHHHDSNIQFNSSLPCVTRRPNFVPLLPEHDGCTPACFPDKAERPEGREEIPKTRHKRRRA